MRRRALAGLLLADLAVVSLVGCASDVKDRSVGASPERSPESLSCGTVAPRPLPTWARAGFHPPDQPATYVLGEHQRILGVLFGPLNAPKKEGQGNKILWVSRVAKPGTGPDLVITARLNGTSVEVERTIAGGPGPSLVDLPRAGCWTLDLLWSGTRDRLAVRYAS